MADRWKSSHPHRSGSACPESGPAKSNRSRHLCRYRPGHALVSGLREAQQGWCRSSWCLKEAQRSSSPTVQNLRRCRHRSSVQQRRYCQRWAMGNYCYQCRDLLPYLSQYSHATLQIDILIFQPRCQSTKKTPAKAYDSAALADVFCLDEVGVVRLILIKHSTVPWG